MMWIAALALAFLGEGGGTRPLDRIELKSGDTVEGYVLHEKPDEIVVLVKSRERKIPLTQVASVRWVRPSLTELFVRHDKLLAKDAPGQMQLARYCQEQQLPGEAEVLALAALCDDPEDVEAHSLLGHVKRQAGWMAKYGDKTVEFEKLVPASADLRMPWKLATSHYTLLTNLALSDAAAMMLDLERYYRAFYGLIGTEVELPEVYTPLGVGVYGDQRTFPEGIGARPAFFDPVTGQVLVNAAAVEPRRALVHEATHQLLHATGAGSRAGRGQIPGWVDEGLAEYMACSLVGEPGRARYELGAIADHHFTTHRDAKKPYDLSRVLQFASGDFLGSSIDLKYAQSYTLVHFFLHGAQGKYRPKFFAYLRSAYAGGASSTDFKKAFDVPEKELEMGWKAHVKSPTR